MLDDLWELAWAENQRAQKTQDGCLISCGNGDSRLVKRQRKQMCWKGSYFLNKRSCGHREIGRAAA